MTTRPDRCETCRFWDRYESSAGNLRRRGLCRRFPPTYGGTTRPYDNPTEVAYSVAPPTGADIWCGEWKARQ